MGRSKAKQPKRIAEKIRTIRLNLEWTQDEMAQALEKHEITVYRGYVGLYEVGERIPTILTLLAYSRIAKVTLEILVDDHLDLPNT